MRKKITIGDIAKDLDISKTAISFVLNGKARESGISIKLEKRILAHIEKIGYRPNQFAQALRTGKTKMIGMMVEDISDPFFSSISRSMEEYAYKKGYKILYSSTENDTRKAKELIQLFRTRQVDGYIIAPPPGIEQDLNDLIDDGFAVVLFDRTIPETDANSVLVDNYDSTYKAMRHLFENGYQNIAFVTLESDQIQMMDRLRAYKDAVDEIDKPYFIKKVIYHDHKDNSISEIEEFLKSRKELDAVFFATNYIADSGLEALRNLKVRIPEELGVVVFDDHSLFRLFTPSITAIAQPIKEISDQVINLMLELLADSADTQSEIKSVVLSSALMVRESTSPRPNAGINAASKKSSKVKK